MSTWYKNLPIEILMYFLTVFLIDISQVLLP